MVQEGNHFLDVRPATPRLTPVRRHLSAPNFIGVVLTALVGLLGPASIAAGEPLPAIVGAHASDAVLVRYRSDVGTTNGKRPRARRVR